MIRASYCFLTMLAFASAGSANENLNPLDILDKLIHSVCIAVPVSGSNNSFQIKGDADARLKGVLDWLADAGLKGAAEYNASKYTGFMQAEVGAKVQIEQDCNLKIYDDFSQPIKDWIKAGSSVRSGKSIISSGDCTVNQQDGSGNVTTVDCTSN